MLANNSRFYELLALQQDRRDEMETRVDGKDPAENITEARHLHSLA